MQTEIWVDTKGTAHVEANVKPGTIELVFTKIVEAKNEKGFKLESIGSINVPAENKADARITLRHLRWGFGKILEVLDAREQEVNKALVRTYTLEEKKALALAAKEAAEMELLALEEAEVDAVNTIGSDLPV